MELTFLAADKPLAKSFTSGELVSSYPLVREVTSRSYQIEDTQDLCAVLRAASKAGWALLKGALDKPLTQQSRRGHSRINQQTEWVCLDIDGIPDLETAAELIASLPVPFQTASCVWQPSSSAGIRTEKGLHGHLFYLLASPISPHLLKLWLELQNYRNALFNTCFSLTADGCGLHYPLDPKLAENSRIIYIAPPVCTDFDDPIEDRFEWIEGDMDRLILNLPELNPEEVKHLRMTTISTLRTASGLPKKIIKIDHDNDEQGYWRISNPDEAVVTGCRVGQEFTRLNINGGDSWAYWHPNNNLKIIYSFKDDSSCPTELFIPEYYRQAVLKKRLKKEARAKTEAIEREEEENEKVEQEPVMFKSLADDKYWFGYYYPDRNREGRLIRLSSTSKKATLFEYFSPKQIHVPEEIPFLLPRFDPQNHLLIDYGAELLNTFEPSIYMDRSDYPSINEPPLHIHQLVSHALGNDEAAVDKFYHWFGYIVQHRYPPRMAWLLHGVPGTGKGLLYHHVLAPILGKQNTASILLRDFISNFEASHPDKLLVLVDEVDIEALKSWRDINDAMSVIRQAITEPVVSFKQKFKSQTTVPNFASYLFLANRPTPLPIDRKERRIDIAPRQEIPLKTVVEEPMEVFVKKLKKELSSFVAYLMHKDINSKLFGGPLRNAARVQLESRYLTSADEMVDQFKEGNMGWILTFLPLERDTVPHKEWERLRGYERVISYFMTTPVKEVRLPREMAIQLFNWIDPSLPALKTKSPNKFTRFLRQRGLLLKKLRYKTVPTLCIEVVMHITEADRDQWAAYRQLNAADMDTHLHSIDPPGDIT